MSSIWQRSFSQEELQDVKRSLIWGIGLKCDDLSNCYSSMAATIM